MAIPSRQIGASTTTNLLWQISKQLERLICVRAGGCVSTTTTTTFIPTSEWYEVTECYTTNVINSVEYPVGTFQLNDGVTYYLGGDWTITNIFYTDPGGAQFGLSNIFQIGCPTTTTTTTTVNLCYCYTITNLQEFGIACSYTNCNGEPVPEFVVTAGASESFCALFDSIFFDSQVIDNGICGLDCPPL